jgi:hypothetical protein
MAFSWLQSAFRTLSSCFDRGKSIKNKTQVGFLLFIVNFSYILKNILREKKGFHASAHGY